MKKVPSKAKKVDFQKYVDVIHSAVLSNAQYDYTRIEMQIMLVVIAAIQDQARDVLAGGDIAFPIDTEESDINRDIQVFFSLNDFPVDMNDHEDRLYQAAKSLTSKTIKIKTNYGWSVQPLISKVDYARENRNIVLAIRPEIWYLLIKASPSFAKYEILPAFQFSSIYSVRFYMMVGTVRHERIYTIDELRQMFRLENEYPNAGNFLRKTVDAAKQELDKRSPLTFEYDRIKKPGTKKITAIKLIKKENTAVNGKEKVEKKIAHVNLRVDMVLDEEEIAWLKTKLLFSDVELNTNFDTFNCAKKTYKEGLLDTFLSIFEYMLRNPTPGRNHKGYFINSLKKNCEKVLSETTGDLFAGQTS